MDWIRKKSLSYSWSWNRYFQGQGCLREFFTIFYVLGASKYIRKPSKNLAYIINKIWPWIGDFQGQGCLQEFSYYFFHIQRVKLHRNTLSNLHDKWDKFFTLYFTLSARLVDISTSSQVGDSTLDIQWFYVWILHFIRGLFVLKFPRS